MSVRTLIVDLALAIANVPPAHRGILDDLAGRGDASDDVDA